MALSAISAVLAAFLVINYTNSHRSNGQHPLTRLIISCLVFYINEIHCGYDTYRRPSVRSWNFFCLAGQLGPSEDLQLLPANETDKLKSFLDLFSRR